MAAKKVFFTDLDGTLLDHETYSFEEAQESLKLLREKNIPLIICSSKTRAEIEHYRKLLRNDHPFISENGGAIFIPVNYFDFEFHYNKNIQNYKVIELGIPYKILINIIKEIKEENFEIIGFCDMTVEDVAKETGLSLEEAKRAKEREYDEAFKLISGEELALFRFIETKGLNWTKGGRFYHIMGNSDKGKAVEILIKLYKKKYGEIITVGLGDSENDFKMLDKVDRPYLVMRMDRTYASDKYFKAGGIGPSGWNLAVRKEVEND